MAIFLTFLFRQHRPGKCLLGYKNKGIKTRSLKTRSLKSPNNDIFPKGYGFGPKIAIFLTFFFRQYRSAECFLRYSRTNEGRFGLLKKEVEKVQNLRFFQRG